MSSVDLSDLLDLFRISEVTVTQSLKTCETNWMQNPNLFVVFQPEMFAFVQNCLILFAAGVRVT